MVLKRITVFVFAFELIAIIAAVGIGFSDGEPLELFAEFHFLTWLSFVQLLFLSVLSAKLFDVDVLGKTKHILRSAGSVWAIIAFGFFFLALDEIFLIHEIIDVGIHAVCNIEETGLTDRIDDILILIYGVIGISILYSHRIELQKYKVALPYLIYGLSLFFVMVALDVLTNRPDILAMIFADNNLVDTIKTWLSIVEDSSKIFAEGFFILGLFKIMGTVPGAPLSSRKISL